MPDDINDLASTLGTGGVDFQEAMRRIAKQGQTLPAANAKPATAQAAMTALGIPDISTMTPDEQIMFAIGAMPMMAAGPEAKVAEEAIPEAAQVVKQGIRAFHGSPHDFSKFDLSKIGTGEGAQAYGHGLYFAENPQVAESYKPTTGSADATVGGKPYDFMNPTHIASALINDYGSRKAAIDNLIQGDYGPHTISGKALQVLQRDQAIPEFVLPSGKTYEVSINANPEHFLDWDKPLSEQHSKVLEALTPYLYHEPSASRRPMSGADAFQNMMSKLSSGNSVGLSADAKSEALRDAGIPGIKYLDQGSRGRGVANVTQSANGNWFAPGSSTPYPTKEAAQQAAAPNATRNYVVFNADLIDIVKKYGIAALIGASATNWKPPKK